MTALPSARSTSCSAKPTPSVRLAAVHHWYPYRPDRLFHPSRLPSHHRGLFPLFRLSSSHLPPHPRSLQHSAQPPRHLSYHFFSLCLRSKLRPELRQRDCVGWLLPWVEVLNAGVAGSALLLVVRARVRVKGRRRMPQGYERDCVRAGEVQ